MLRVVHIRNKKWSDEHGILQAWSIGFVAILLNHQKRPPRKYCYQSSEITAYRNKISLKLGYRTVNVSKYVRCARTFYLMIAILPSLLMSLENKNTKKNWPEHSQWMSYDRLPRIGAQVQISKICLFKLKLNNYYIWKLFISTGFNL